CGKEPPDRLALLLPSSPSIATSGLDCGGGGVPSRRVPWGCQVARQALISSRRTLGEFCNHLEKTESCKGCCYFPSSLPLLTVGTSLLVFPPVLLK
ncbi:Hypothetical predicted protein, partial [Podarcis lilfordi]